MRLIDISLKPLALVAIIATPATVAFTLTPTEAVAEKGGNGNGNGANRNRGNRGENGRGNNGKGNVDASERRGNNNGRGAIASELKSLNAAHASPTALANASPNSMPGKLYTYQQAVLAEREYDAQLAESEATYRALSEMTEERFLELNPDLNYAEALAATAANYEALVQAADGADDRAADALDVLNGGTPLSEGALQELWRLLDLS